MLSRRMTPFWLGRIIYPCSRGIGTINLPMWIKLKAVHQPSNIYCTNGSTNTKWKWKWQSFIMHRLFKWSDVNKNICNSTNKKLLQQNRTPHCLLSLCLEWNGSGVAALKSMPTMNYVIYETNLHFFLLYSECVCLFSSPGIRETIKFSWNKWYIEWKMPSSFNIWRAAFAIFSATSTDGNGCACVRVRMTKRRIHQYSKSA